VSEYKIEPLDFAGLKTIPIRERGGKVRLEHLGRPHAAGAGLGGWLNSLPHVLAADGLRAAINAIEDARRGGKPVLWGLGGHVVKCGLAPVLIDLMHRGFATGFALNGATAIHDFEIAIAGATSEDVEAVLPDGQFGTAEETGRQMNEAIAAGVRDGIGLGESLGRHLASAPHRQASLLAAAYAARVPVTVHVAIGTDTPHTHPAANPAAIGQATHRDFRLFCREAAELNRGGVYLNAGSAVLLPEVFLKAVSVVRNLGCQLAGFTTVNLDFLQHYRPKVNVVERPHANAGGRGISLTGHHELMIPLLAALLVERQS
jgi:hypothetical protein